MADNTTLPGTGEVVRDIDKSGKKTQVVVIDKGGSGAEDLLTGSMPTLPTLVTADADVTQHIVVTTAGTPVQGPAKTNPGGWMIGNYATNTTIVYFMYHGQTNANKGIIQS